MKKLVAMICSISIIIAISLTLGCGGGGGGGSSNNGNDLFKVINTVNKNISADSATQIGVLSSDGIQLNLAKGALNDNSNIAVRQYSNDAAMARFTENFPSLASFTVISSLYELTAKDNKSKRLTILEIPSEIEVAYGATLTIEPGVVLLREGTPSSILVSIFGNLRMVGTSDEPITANRIYFITGKNTESNKYPSIDIGNSKLYRCAINFDDYAKNVIVKNNDILHPKDDDYDEYGRSAMLIFNGMNETIIENNIFDTETSEIYVKILCGGRASKNIFKKYTNIDNIDLVNNLFCQGIRLVQVNSAPFIRYNSFLGTSIFYTSERSDFEHDISNNYWGNADEKTIKAMLHDKNSDLGLCGEFIYKPMLKTPHKDTPKL